MTGVQGQHQRAALSHVLARFQTQLDFGASLVATILRGGGDTYDRGHRDVILEYVARGAGHVAGLVIQFHTDQAPGRNLRLQRRGGGCVEVQGHGLIRSPDGCNRPHQGVAYIKIRPSVGGLTFLDRGPERHGGGGGVQCVGHHHVPDGCDRHAR